MDELHKQTDSGSIVEIDVRMPKPWTQLFEVSVSALTGDQEHIDFVMPVWTPGSYLVREHARNVQDFHAIDAEGRRLRWEKIRKNAWRVYAGVSARAAAFYRVLGFEPSVRASFLDDTRAYISASSLVCFVSERLKSPYLLRIHPPDGWTSISTSLDPVPGQDSAFFAPDYDTLVDCPVEIGTHQVLEFSVRDVPHRVALTGHGNFDPDALRRDLQRVVETSVELMGGVPYRHYTFLINLTADGNSGIEHRDSCALQVSHWTFKPEDRYRRFLSLAAHEHFHLWNGKRLHPAGLGPFNYEAESYTRLLWVTEGFTDYYAEQILRRAGLSTADQYLEDLSRVIGGYLDTPGRFVQPLAEASYDAWIKFYRPDPHTANNAVSYYVKGNLVALILDLEIRRCTGNRTLDDVLRLLFDRFARRSDGGFTEGDLREVCSEVAGPTLDSLIDDYVYGTAELDLPRFLQLAGLRFAGSKQRDNPAPRPWLGASLKTIDGCLTVVGVTAGSPAHEQGLNVNDEILAMDGFRVSQESLAQRIFEKCPDTRIELLVARGGLVRTMPFILGGRDEIDYRIVKAESATEEQKSLYERWLSARWA